MEKFRRGNQCKGLVIDVKKLLIGYRRHLEKRKINGQRLITQRDVEYTDFLSFLNIQVEWEGSFKVIEQNEYNRFMDSGDGLDVMDMIFLSSENFIEEFEETYKIGSFERCFVSAKYIDDIENRMIVVVTVDSIDKEFIVDVV